MRSDSCIRAWLQTLTGIVAVLLAVQFLTGVLLAFYYVPSLDHAYTTVSYVEKGRVVRFRDSLIASLRIAVAHRLHFFTLSGCF